MKISVIIPVYNSTQYLERCIESIRTQSYLDIEVILVDDGSSDGSEMICDQYVSLDSRIKCVHQKNAGTSAARNTGIKHATGQYIMFMDNDDYCGDVNCIETIVTQLASSDADVLLYSTMEYWENSKKYVYPKNQCRREEIVGKAREIALTTLIQRGLLYSAVWSKVIKRELVLEHNIMFPEGMRNEDSEWTANLLLWADTYDWMEKPFYVYRKGHTYAQTSKPNTYKIVMDLKEIIIKYYKIIKNHEGKYSEAFKVVYCSYLAYLYSVWMAQAEMIKTEAIQNDIKEMRQYAEVLQYDINPSVKMVKTIIRVFGYKISAKFLAFYMKKKYNIKDK